MSGLVRLIQLDRVESPLTCGTKAFNLARLARAGYPVPQGLVIENAALEQHLRVSGALDSCHDLLADLKALEPRELLKRASQVRACITGTLLPDELRTALDRAYDIAWRGQRLAVRSSAACEDSGQASFAGQLDSILNVSDLAGIESAVRTVWASLWSDRCLLYARRRGLEPARMGVIVQEMVEARHSGVLFTRDIRAAGNSGELVIEYVDGLCDRLVSGELTPTRVRVRHADLAIMREDTSSDGVRSPLSDSKLRELARIALDLERNFGRPQDVEWSIDTEERIVLLQSRPITSIDRCATDVVWSNANIAENFPDPVSPFVYSLVAHGYTAYFRNLALSFGISRRRVAAMAEALDNIVGVQASRLYYNLTNIHTIIYLAPFGSWLAHCFNEFTGASELPNVDLRAVGSLRRAVELVRIVVKTSWQYLLIGRRVRRFECTVDCYAATTHPSILAERSPRELLRDLRGFLEIRLNRWNDAALADVAAMVCYGLLKLVLSRWFGSENSSLHNDLLKGLPGLASARPVAELWRLSRVVREDPVLLGLFLGEGPETLLAHLEKPSWRRFREQLDRYLDEWGYRYSRELMLTCPTPQEDPIPVIRVLQSYVREMGRGPEAIREVQALDRVLTTDSCAARLTAWPIWRHSPFSRAGRFRLLLRATQGSIGLRERVRMKQALLYTRLRHVMLRIGETLVRQGQLKSREDVFFITVGEVQSLLAGTAMLPDMISKLVALRRGEQAEIEVAIPPDSFVLPWGEHWQPETNTPDGNPSGTSTLRGTGACGGIAEGQAAVVLDVTEADRVRTGDILVTRQTDPGWAVVFFLIKGLVIERGGMLSHGAIIAREYGIPAVVGAREATRRIQVGDRLRVDGDRGIVELCDG
jgi:pyruvate,water dikinase